MYLDQFRTGLPVKGYEKIRKEAGTDMKKRIAHISGGLTTGGVEAVIYNYFSKIDRKDYELYYITYANTRSGGKKEI